MSRTYWLGILLGVLLAASSFAPQAQAAPDMMPLLLSAPWHGSYVCNQGLTRLRLTLRPLPGGSERRMEAEFAFSADPDNPQVPTGSFRMTGTWDPTTRALSLKPENWIDQPVDPSYRMVSLEGKVFLGDGQAMIRGRVATYGCEDFAVWQFFIVPATGR